MEARRRGAQHVGTLRGGPAGRRRANRPYQHHQPLRGLAAGVFPRQGHARTGIVESCVSYAILRPAILFGKEDILVNNIAWTLRRLPVFGIFGDGRYRLQPIYVDDLAALAVEQGARRENTVINAVGPETFSYRELVTRIGQAIGKRRLIVSVPPWFGYAMSRVMGKLVGDTIVTRDEIEGMMAEQLYVDAPPAGKTVLTEWAAAHADTLGRHYASELARRKDRTAAYGTV